MKCKQILSLLTVAVMLLLSANAVSAQSQVQTAEIGVASAVGETGAADTLRDITSSEQDCSHATIDQTTGKCTDCAFQMPIRLTKGANTEWLADMETALERVTNSTAAENAVIRMMSVIPFASDNVALPAGTYTIDTNAKVIYGKNMLIQEGTDVTFTSTGTGEGSIGVYIQMTGGKFTVEKNQFAFTFKMSGGKLCVKDDAYFARLELSGGEAEIFGGKFGQGIHLGDTGKTYRDLIAPKYTAYDMQQKPLHYSEWSEATTGLGIYVKKCPHDFGEDDVCQYCNIQCNHKTGETLTVDEGGKCTQCDYRYYTAKVQDEAATTYYKTVPEAVAGMAADKQLTLFDNVTCSQNLSLNSGIYNLGEFELQTDEGHTIEVCEDAEVTLQGMNKNGTISGGIGLSTKVDGTLHLENALLNGNAKMGANAVLSVQNGTADKVDASALTDGDITFSSGCTIGELIIPTTRNYLDFLPSGCVFYEYDATAQDYTNLKNAATATEMKNVQIKVHKCDFDVNALCACGRETILPEVSYLDENGAEQKVKKYKLVENAASDLTWTSGVYVVQGNVTVDGEILLPNNGTATTTLILTDGAVLTAKGMRNVNTEDNRCYANFNVYAQSKGNTAGRLRLTGFSQNGIVYGMNVVSNVNINGGKINIATEDAPTDALSYGMLSSKANVKICGGAEVTVTSGDINVNQDHGTAGSYGICAQSGTVSVENATVTVTTGAVSVVGGSADDIDEPRVTANSVGIWAGGIYMKENAVVNSTAKNVTMTRTALRENTAYSDEIRSHAIWAEMFLEVSGGRYNLVSGETTIVGNPTNKDKGEAGNEEISGNMRVTGGMLNLKSAYFDLLLLEKGATLSNLLADNTYGVKTSDAWYKADSIVTEFSGASVAKLPFANFRAEADKNSYYYGENVILSATCEPMADPVNYTWYAVSGNTETKIAEGTGVDLKPTEGTDGGDGAVLKVALTITKPAVGTYAYKCVATTIGSYSATDTVTFTVKEKESASVSSSGNRREKVTAGATEVVQSEWMNPFADVSDNDWYFENVKYVNENGWMNGVTNHMFAPHDTMTRAMLVTVLWRAAGQPQADDAMSFADVDENGYYAEAIRWAASEGITVGVTETEFAPEASITREQIATIMYRYAQYQEADVSIGEDTNILVYDDFDEISEYATAAFRYAVGSGLMKGKTDTTLCPQEIATRAEIAAIIHRYVARFAK